MWTLVSSSPGEHSGADMGVGALHADMSCYPWGAGSPPPLPCLYEVSCLWHIAHAPECLSTFSTLLNSKLHSRLNKHWLVVTLIKSPQRLMPPFPWPQLWAQCHQRYKARRRWGSRGQKEQMAHCGGNRLVQNTVEEEREKKRVCVMQFLYGLYGLTSKCLHTAASHPQSWAPLGSQVLGSIFNGNPEDVWERAG